MKAVHAAIDDTIPIMEFIRVPVKDRCKRCDFTPKEDA